MNMTEPNFPASPRTGLTPRRIALLGSVAAVAAALIAGGPAGLRPFSAEPVQAAEAVAQHPADFADLVAKVKPAVISVRVKIGAENSSFESPHRNAPMDRFFRQFGDELGPQFGQQQQRRPVTGEGSGFFISSDGYAVTN